jgi:nicotinate-nucleotide adenylyltransferase
VWWLVSPQNPLKPARGMASYASRLASARAVACYPRIRVSEFERQVGATQTARVLRKLTRAYRECRFVWIMGADNLIQIAKWHDWQSIFATLPIAVYDRPSYCEAALASVAARRFVQNRMSADEADTLADRQPPAWMFFRGRLDPTSATEIRAGW